MRKINIIAKQVLKKNIKSFSWWFLILLPIFVVMITLLVGGKITNNNETTVVGLVNRPQLVKVLNESHPANIKYQNYSKKVEIKKAIQHEKIDGQLVLNPVNFNAKLVVKERLAKQKVSLINNQLFTLKTISNAKAMGLTNRDLNQLMAHPQISQTTLKNSKHSHDNYGIEFMIAQAFSIFMYIFLISYGSTIAQEIGTEKGSRIEESILITVKTSSQFIGKLLGVAGLILINILIYIIMGGLVYIFREHIDLLKQVSVSFDLSQIPVRFALEMLFFFVVGILQYAILSALCGSLVANQEQIAQASMPAVFIAMAGYFISMLEINNGSSMITEVANYVPFLSPMVLPGSLAVGQLSNLQVIISMSINVIFLIGFGMFSMKVYRKNVLIYDNNKLFSFKRLKV